ncbi:MAG: hypothetical protein A2Y10_02680 [Planctomycetes bacterium GWF2_41_51]|nr:MAG: hypothetical protein A2Y10_02680 [Planctomycetes bacterium GWF2_41_51]HBG27455.1 hypothetical protein [Phycisphaerales bacterium]
MDVKKIFIFILPLIFMNISCEYCDDAKLSKIIKQEIERYPEQRLVDIYKTFFQGFFGPAHLIRDANSAKEYIGREIAEANEFEDYDFHELPPNGKYVRVNLRLIKEGKISLEDFTEAFVKSAKPVSDEDIEEWKKIWPRVLAEIEKQKHDFSNFEEDKKYINSLLAENKYVVHHSKEFNSKYPSHYRIVSSEKLHK